jgi:prophage antirepressor-like protein/very-short-patch-repair endonuclease
MDKITKQFCIKKHKKGYYNLNNIVKNIIKSKSPKSYMDKISGKKRIGTVFYITEEQFIKILKKSRSATGKQAYKLLKESDENNQTTEIVDSRVDSDNNLFSFNGKGLKIVNVGDEIWFKGKDVAKILEYENYQQSLRINIDKDDKITAKKLRKLENIKEIEKLKGEQPHTIFINFNGFRNIIIKSRKPISIPLAKKFNIDLLTKIQCKEAQVLNYVIQLCKIKNIIYDLQFSCGDYSIDMYIHKYKLAIEIDENNHSDRDPEYEKNREEFIKNTLNCKFIRFDPDGKDCFISKLLLDLLKIFKDKEKMTKFQSSIQKEKTKQSKYQLEAQKVINERIELQIELNRSKMELKRLEIEAYNEKKSTRKVKRPSYEQLKTDLENSNYVQVGKKYNVSDNSIRKWIRTYKKYDN